MDTVAEETLAESPKGSEKVLPSRDAVAPAGVCGSPLETLSCLLRSVENLNASLDLRSGLERLAGVLRLSVPFDTFGVLLLDEIGQDLRFHFAVGIDPEVVEHWRFGRGQGIVGTVAATGEPRVVDDVRREALYIGTDDAIRSEAAIPLVTKNRTIGVLDATTFPASESILLFALTVVGGAYSFAGQIIAGILYRAVPAFLNDIGIDGDLAFVIFGVGLLHAIVTAPTGIAGQLGDLVAWLARKWRGR